MTILEILEENDSLCMDDEGDRTILAAALQAGLAFILRDLSQSYHDEDNSPGIEAAAMHIELMSGE